MKKLLFLLPLAGVTLMADAGPSPFGVRAIHLDLARQMETVDFVCDYIDLVADAGHNMIKLYFEGRLKTPTTQALPDAECYSTEDIRRICDKAESRGVEVFPSVEALGHNEHFFRDGKRRELSEERDGSGRWDTGGKCYTFCATLPAAKEFLARYLTEVAEMFPKSRYIGVGLDESWHMGFCKLCAERRKTEGFGGIFSKHVAFVNEVLNKAGKTVQMSDDFYEFFPERLAECPKNLTFSHWMYDKQVSRWGHRGHFAQRIRCDLLRDYAKLGIHAFSACSLYYDYDNVRSLTEYSAAAGCDGMVLSQWEMTDRCHGQFVPVMVGIGAYWQDPDRFVSTDFARVGLAKVFPKLTADELDAIVPTMHIHLDLPQTSVGQTLNRMPRQDQLVACQAALAAFRRSAYAPGENVAPRALSPEALADDYVGQLRLHIAKERLRLLGPALSSPRRVPNRVARAREELAEVRRELVDIAARRRIQQDVWRKGCLPRQFDTPVASAIKTVDALLALDVKPAADEWWCEADLSMPEYHMHPYWSILLKVDGKWRKVAGGYWKAEMWDWANFEHLLPFRMDGAPTDLRIEYHGRGPCSLNYLTVENRDRRYGPAAITKVEGLVRNPENLLVDNWKSASFGWPDTMETFHHPELQDLVSAVEFTLREL